MQLIGKSKIGKKRSKPSITYPLIRLPREQAGIIGRLANIYETEREGCTAFVITFEDEEKNRSTSQVAQPPSKVGQPLPQNVGDSRLAALESEIAELKSILIHHKVQKDSRLSKEEKIKGRGRDSNPRRGLHRAATSAHRANVP
ncbi:MAG: hypothetical protein ABR979_05800 [Halobacteriota archaeon]